MEKKCNDECEPGFFPCPEHDVCIDLRWDLLDGSRQFYCDSEYWESKDDPEPDYDCPSVLQNSKALCDNEFWEEELYKVLLLFAHA